MTVAKADRWPVAFLAVVVAGLALSAIRPHDYFTWFLEVVPVLLGLPLFALIYVRHRATGLACFLVTAHCLVLMIGGHYTYAEVPAFNWLRDHLHLARNDYDRLGHFMQGFVPAVLAREVLLRQKVVRRGPWLFFLVLCVCLAISASYELFEWAVAEAKGEAADSFLGTQGDVWDTQWDMFFCLVGATCSMVAMPRLHDRQLAKLGDEREPR